MQHNGTLQIIRYLHSQRHVIHGMRIPRGRRAEVGNVLYEFGIVYHEMELYLSTPLDGERFVVLEHLGHIGHADMQIPSTFFGVDRTISIRV